MPFFQTFLFSLFLHSINTSIQVMKVGDIVWASAGYGDGSYEEPATIVEVNVNLDEIESQSESDEEDKKQNQKDGVKGDGVRIKYKISLTEAVLASDQVRLFNSGTSRKRRSRKNIALANGPLSESFKQESNADASSPKCQNRTVKEAKSKASAAVAQRQNSSRSVRSDKGIKVNLKADDSHVSDENDDLRLINLKTEKVTRTIKKRKKDAIRDEKKTDALPAKISKKAKKTSESSSSVARSKQNDQKSTVTSSPFFENDKSKTTVEIQFKERKEGSSLMRPKKGTKKIYKSDVSNDDCEGMGEPDGNGGLDQGSTYIVEYAKTARATCKRCNERIKKGELRIGHRPLFRGKPGYQVFKHLRCIVFSEEISCAEDVGGFSKLKSEDYDALVSRVDASASEIKQESEELAPDELVQKEFSGEIRRAPEGLSAELLPFQVEGASWMYHQETRTDIKGGILADEMGMGKTLQTITTTLDNRPKLQRSIPGSKYPPCVAHVRDAYILEETLWDEGIKDWKHEMVMNDVHNSILTKSNKNGSGGGARAGTLVVCPLIALTQWRTEIEKFSKDGSMSVMIYHGPDRSVKTPREMLRKHDIVLTTYQVLEADFRKMVSPNRVKCPNCGGKFRIDKLRVHLKYFCGENAERTEAQARQRRNSERQTGNNTRRRDGHSNESKKIQKKKMAIKVRGNKTYDSESELSIGSNESAEKDIRKSARRRTSSRAASSNATKRMAKSLRWEDEKLGSDNDDEYEEESDEESDSSVDLSLVTLARKSVTRTKTKPPSKNPRGNEDTKRAIAKQAKALKTLRSKKFDKKKKDENKNHSWRGKKGNEKKTPKKVKRERKSYSESEDSLEGDDDIDMGALIEEAMAGARMSMLHSFTWWRIVLDEAHMIKSRSSQTAAAAFALTGIHRWCLSGTPLQNRVGEFYSLVRFLRLDPMAYYFCRAKGCECKQIHYRMWNGKCKVSTYCNVIALFRHW